VRPALQWVKQAIDMGLRKRIASLRGSIYLSTVLNLLYLISAYLGSNVQRWIHQRVAQSGEAAFAVSFPQVQKRSVVLMQASNCASEIDKTTNQGSSKR